MSSANGVRVTKQCVTCGNKFSVHPYRAVSATACSNQCRTLARRRERDRICTCCGIQFYARPAEITKGGGIFCSMICRRSYKTEHGTNYPQLGTDSVHRIVAEQKLGRALAATEVVHHIDHNRKNNAPENLFVFKNQSEHMRFHGMVTRGLVARFTDPSTLPEFSPHCIDAKTDYGPLFAALENTP
jgi:hypothetical protein